MSLQFEFVYFFGINKLKLHGSLKKPLCVSRLLSLQEWPINEQRIDDDTSSGKSRNALKPKSRRLAKLSRK